MTTDDIRDAAISVEAKLASYSKRMDGGVNIRFQVHPHDIPPELKEAEIGTRYLLAMVELNDQEEPVAPRKTKPEHRLVTRAAILCKDPLFQAFLRNIWSIPSVVDEASAANALRTMWRIESRRELVPGSKAAEHFDNLLTDWTAWKRGEEEDREFIRRHEGSLEPCDTLTVEHVKNAKEWLKEADRRDAVGTGTPVAPDPQNAPAATAGPVRGIEDLVKGK